MADMIEDALPGSQTPDDPGRALAWKPANVGELPWRAVAQYPDKVSVEDGDIALSYAEVDERTRRVAALLRARGVRRGDRVLLLLRNDFRFVEAFLGALRVGASVVLGNVKLGHEMLAYIGAHSEAVVQIAHGDLADRAEAINAAASGLTQTFLVGSETAWAENYDSVVAAADPAGGETEPVDAQDEALLMYTSGSSGLPKGCRLSHANTWWQARSSARSMLLEERDKGLVMGPLYHANALWAAMLPMLYTGGALTILPGFDAAAVLDAIARYRPTYTSGTPSMFTLLLNEHRRVPGRDLSSIELLMCGSAPVPEELMEELVRVFGCDISETYGLTEGGANVLTPRWGVKKIGSTGLPVPEVEIRVVDLDDETRDVPVGEIGELWSRSPANALGYLKQPEVTAERMTPDGWLKTGDLVRLDGQGYVYICGRKDDMISVGGENVYPKEVETILLGHPEIADACVVPARHPIKGEAPVAWVVLRTPGALDEEAVRRYFLERGPAYAHPRRVFFSEALPLSGTNKLDRKWLEEETDRRLPDGLSPGAHRI